MTIAQRENTAHINGNDRSLAGCQLVTDSYEVEQVFEHLSVKARKKAESFGVDSLFVAQKDGDYTKVFGFRGIIPHNDFETVKLK